MGSALVQLPSIRSEHEDNNICTWFGGGQRKYLHEAAGEGGDDYCIKVQRLCIPFDYDVAIAGAKFVCTESTTELLGQSYV